MCRSLIEPMIEICEKNHQREENIDFELIEVVVVVWIKHLCQTWGEKKKKKREKKRKKS